MSRKNANHGQPKHPTSDSMKGDPMDAQNDIEAGSLASRWTREEFWNTEGAQKGFFHVGFDGRDFCLLVPDCQCADISEIRTGRHVVITLGFHVGTGRTMYEILFEDGSSSPYALHILPEMFERPLSMAETASLARRLIVYTRGFVEVAAMSAYFREVETLPCLKPWKGKLQETQSIEDDFRRQVESLTLRNDSLSEQVRMLKDASRDVEGERQAAAVLRREADRLQNESFSKDARIKSLEGEVVAIGSEIERRVSEQVGEVRKTAEENELRALVAEEDQAQALRRADKAERVSKRLELLLRKNGIEPAMAFENGNT